MSEKKVINCNNSGYKLAGITLLLGVNQDFGEHREKVHEDDLPHNGIMLNVRISTTNKILDLDRILHKILRSRIEDCKSV